jgi:hypothetical protein
MLTLRPPALWTASRNEEKWRVNAFLWNTEKLHIVAQLYCCAVQCCTARCAVRYGTVRYGTVRYGTVRYGTVRYGMGRDGTVRYSALECNAAMYSTNIVQCPH